MLWKKEELKPHRTEITLYRCSCQHCDTAERELGGLARKYGALLEVRRVENQAELKDFAGFRTPIVCINGKQVTHFQVSVKKWEEAIKSSAAIEPSMIIGEIVDMPCYMESKARGGDHKKCAEECIKKGDPIGLVTRSGELFLLVESRKFSGIYGGLKTLAGEDVRITGDLCERGGVHAIMVRAVEAV